MRRIFCILMIALVPLRGWLGEAMATDMAAMHIAEIQAIHQLSTDQKYHSPDMLECDMHPNLAAKQSSEQSDEVPTQSSCNSCQACHASALINSIPVAPSVAVQTPVPLAHIATLTSASVALGQKPPIL